MRPKTFFSSERKFAPRERLDERRSPECASSTAKRGVMHPFWRQLKEKRSGDVAIKHIANKTLSRGTPLVDIQRQSLATKEHRERRGTEKKKKRKDCDTFTFSFLFSPLGPSVRNSPLFQVQLRTYEKTFPASLFSLCSFAANPQLMTLQEIAKLTLADGSAVKAEVSCQVVKRARM